MEDIGQSYGYILYRTSIPHPQSGDLRIDELHSYAQIYVDGTLVGTLDRKAESILAPDSNDPRQRASRYSGREHGPRELRPPVPARARQALPAR